MKLIMKIEKIRNKNSKYLSKENMNIFFLNFKTFFSIYDIYIRAILNLIKDNSYIENKNILIFNIK
jgi:hypothetical protein